MRNHLVHAILKDEHATRGLMDPEARILIEWLVDAAELLSKHYAVDRAQKELTRIMRRCRAIKRFVILWCYELSYGPAAQLAAAEGFLWPLPPPDFLDSCLLLEALLECENVIEDECEEEYPLARLAA